MMSSTSVRLDRTTEATACANVVPTVCQLVFSLNVGGAEVLAKEFVERGNGEFRFVIACLDECGPLGDDLRRAGYRIEVLRRKPGTDLGCARRLARFCRAENVGLIHAHQCGPFHYAALARLMFKRLSILFTEHGRHHPDRRSWKRIVVNRILLRGNDQVVAVGQFVKDALIANEGIPAHRIDVIYNGRDLGRYRTDPHVRAAVRQELNLVEQQVVVMQVARLSWEKDHATAMSAIGRLAQQCPSVRLILVGDGPERSAIEASVRRLGVEKQVRLLGMRLDVPRLLQAADVFLLTSTTEGIPLTLIEGMACGLPCVATRVGGIPEVIVPGETGLLANPSDPEDIANCLQRLACDDAMRRRMGAAGRGRARAIFDDRAMHAKYGEVYRRLLRLPPAAASIPAAY